MCTTTSNSFAGFSIAVSADSQFIGPVLISSTPVDDLGRGFDLRFFSPDFESHIGFGIGTDTEDVNLPEPSWIDHNHGTTVSNTLEVNVAK